MFSWDEPRSASTPALGEGCQNQTGELALLLEHLPCGFAQRRVLHDKDRTVGDIRVVQASPCTGTHAWRHRRRPHGQHRR